jgi:hypothetical protein
MHELKTRLTMILLSLLSNLLLYMTRDIVQLNSFLCEPFDSSYRDLESCRINISDLIRFVDKGFAFVLART